MVDQFCSPRTQSLSRHALSSEMTTATMKQQSSSFSYNSSNSETTIFKTRVKIGWVVEDKAVTHVERSDRACRIARNHLYLHAEVAEQVGAL